MTKENQPQPHNGAQKSTEIVLFQNNNILTFIYKKAEKISCALYLITDNFGEKEPLRWKIRDKSLSLLEEIISLRNNLSNNPSTKEALSVKILEIVSLLGLSFRSGFISEMNHEIIKTESLKLNDFISSRLSLEGSGGASFEKGFFNISSPDLFREELSREETFENPIKDISIRQDKRHFNKGHMSFRQDNKKSETPLKEPKPTPKTEERRRKILSIIRSRGDVSIKDIVSLIKEYSEKTLQRDLTFMIGEGAIKKTGERRWSRYSSK